MPLCTLHLLELHNTAPIPLLTFLSALKSSNASPLVVSRVIRWIILPTHLSTEHLLARNTSWDILLILPTTDPLPPSVAKLVRHHWSVTAGVPSRLTQAFHSKNVKLLHPDASSVPKLVEDQSANKTTKSAQSLELSAELNEWINEFVRSSGKEGTGAVSMFNLLAFKPGMKSEYLKYGAAFAESIGSRHGGNAKIVGNVTHVNGIAKSKEEEDSVRDDWDEIALAHYPSIRHFREMLVSAEYQEVNKRYRVPSLWDTCILMTSEIAVEELMIGSEGAKL
ncbi:uncharacterized protein K460DRAFT_273633 [Cucurbitaria berberidis CBS 394.84]|uniref:DUF1330 domain-containing protein n=1 Tax=Cucurbitaria berberidis CBS 394.84 TaxID=1168544 RepID=A0A9P4LCX2_9PLEO|nr:uncharacterized protein K460DRAFT_273633 [Cucurbitaria berberidis CBS 394.84]KAF1851241.1 hypothetical protein K460DRAFT_273633 [Cucurbitaria berberidis CBS 394.84]